MPIGLYMDLGSSAACRGQQYGVLDPAGDDARMVLIKHQAPDGADQFLFHASSTTPVDQLVESLAEVWNGRRRLHKLCEAATKLLSTHGKKVSTADAVSVHTCVSDATEVIGTAHSRDAAALTAETIHGLASGLQAAVEAAYGGAKSVPSSGGWADAVKAVTTGSEWMPPGAELWLATRQFDPGTKLSDRVGRNEKQRITVRLQRPTEANQTAGNKRKKSAAASKKAVAATVEVAQTASAGAEGGPVKSAAAAVVDSHMLRHYVHQRFGVAQSAKRPRVSSAKVEDPDEEEGRLTLKVEHFAMVKDSEKAKWYLRDERLQNVIKQIDAHESDKDREAALQERLEKDPPFAEAVDELLISMGFARRDGSTVVSTA